MKQVIWIAKGIKDTITIKGETYKVTDGLKSLCKKLLLIYEICIVFVVGIGINVAPMIGSSSFFSDMLFVVILLVLLSVIFDLIAKAIFRKVTR